MRTGTDTLHDGGLSPHVTAIVTGATTIFTRALCRDMFMLQHLTSDRDTSGIARACACRLMKSDKCAELEKLVAEVVNAPDGMPEVTNKPLLAEVLQIYSEAANAERAGCSTEFRRDTLVPAIVEQAMDEPVLTEDAAAAFLTSINQYATEWDSFQPRTPFQQIVCDAIGRLSL